jgi:hypothetical protein
MMVGLIVAQFLLVGRYLSLVERGTKRSELVGLRWWAWA